MYPTRRETVTRIRRPARHQPIEHEAPALVESAFYHDGRGWHCHSFTNPAISYDLHYALSGTARGDTVLFAYCSCPAGAFRQPCKHGRIFVRLIVPRFVAGDRYDRVYINGRETDL